MSITYRLKNSTEAILTRVLDDEPTLLDNNNSVLPLVLDLLSAFDTFNHVTLIDMVLSGYVPE